MTPTPEEYKTGYLQGWLSWAVGTSEPLSPETLPEGSEEPSSSEEASQERVDLGKSM